MVAQQILIAGRQVTITGRAGNYFEMRQMAYDMGGRPISHALDDRLLVGKDAFKSELRKGIFLVWENEILAHPAEGGNFPKGKDIICPNTHWTLLASDVSRLAQEAFDDEKGLYLYIKPAHIIVDKKRTIIQPQTIKVVRNVVQKSGQGGKVDEETRLPLQVSQEVWDKLTEDDKRWLLRIPGVAIQPIARDSYSSHTILANIHPFFGCAVLVEGIILHAPRAEPPKQ